MCTFLLNFRWEATRIVMGDAGRNTEPYKTVSPVQIFILQVPKYKTPRVPKWRSLNKRKLGQFETREVTQCLSVRLCAFRYIECGQGHGVQYAECRHGVHKTASGRHLGGCTRTSTDLVTSYNL